MERTTIRSSCIDIDIRYDYGHKCASGLPFLSHLLDNVCLLDCYLA